MEAKLRKSSFVWIAIDNSVINWKAFQGLERAIQADDKKRTEYEAILSCFPAEYDGALV